MIPRLIVRMGGLSAGSSLGKGDFFDDGLCDCSGLLLAESELSLASEEACWRECSEGECSASSADEESREPASVDLEEEPCDAALDDDELLDGDTLLEVGACSEPEFA